jgi:hypothetical protein
MLEVTLPGAARVSEEQAVDQSGGHDWRCPVFEKVAFTMYPITTSSMARCAAWNSILLHQLKPKEKQ